MLPTHREGATDTQSPADYWVFSGSTNEETGLWEYDAQGHSGTQLLGSLCGGSVERCADKQLNGHSAVKAGGVSLVSYLLTSLHSFPVA